MRSTAELMDALHISRQAVNRHLQGLVRDGLIIKQGTSRATAFYVLNDDRARERLCGKPKRFKKMVVARGLSEDLLFNELQNQIALLDGLSEKELESFRYAFTEMVNNAIDHSRTKFIDVDIRIDKGRASFCVIDKGVGAFENILRKKHLASTMDAIQDLLKGKQTTAPEYHSGEGIFFTSKIADRFIIESHKKSLIIDNRISDVFIEDRRFLKGTTVHYEMDLPSKKNLIDIFKEYTSEEFFFDKSRIKVKMFDSGDSYISRSQAKRLLHSMENFKEIVLDFSGVHTVGQSFADEVFRVFKKLHPQIAVAYKGANENVEFMIRRATMAASGSI